MSPASHEPLVALIVGADAMLSAAVRRQLSNHRHKTYGTTRRPVSDPGVLHLDLAATVADWPAAPADATHVFLSAAITQQKKCEADPVLARFINVDQTKLLIEMYEGSGMHITYPSTNLVLGGERPFQPAGSAYSPQGVYGQTKAEIEKFLIGKNAVIARLAKVFNGRDCILSQWKLNLEHGEAIHAFTDLMVSPVSEAYASGFIVKLMESRSTGIWQISGEQELSYYDLAKALCNHLGKNTGLVKPGQASHNYAKPAHPSLDGSVTEREFGLAPQRLEQLFRDIF